MTSLLKIKPHRWHGWRHDRVGRPNQRRVEIRVSWKNRQCPCSMWIDPARVNQHINTPFHTRWIAQRERAKKLNSTKLSRIDLVKEAAERRK